MSALPVTTVTTVWVYPIFLDYLYVGESNALFLGDFVIDPGDNVFGTITEAYIDGTDVNNGPNIQITGISVSISGVDVSSDFWGNLQGFVLNALQGNDTVIGSARADILLGFAGNDTLIGGAEGDELNGGGGFDTASYASSPAAVTINLAGDAGTGGHAQGDTIFEVEQLIGSNFSDELGGGTINSTVKGLGGNDFISGGIGNNTLVGGTGKDTLQGGSGRDFFDFNSLAEAGKGAGRDTITDFNRQVDDRIDLSTIDAKSGVGGNQAFKFIGTQAFHDVKGELRCKNGVVQGDVNGDGKADFEIKVNVATMVAGDFFL